MKLVIAVLTVIYAGIACVFAIGSVSLLGLAAIELWQAVSPASEAPIATRAANAIESIGLITVSLMSLEMAQTVVEEEVVRRVHVSAPTRYAGIFLASSSWWSSRCPSRVWLGSSKRFIPMRRTCRARHRWRSPPPRFWLLGASSSA